ncbi:hypothetical protein TNCV_4325251 [Trichonephila clavipes]|nr:hypothetical protein TNCV_4325251 [Trichonephila clavipes]
MPPVGRSQNKTHEIHRGKRLEKCLSLALSTIQVTVRISSAQFPEGTIDGDTTYLPQFWHGIEGKGNILLFFALVIQPTRLSDPLI